LGSSPSSEPPDAWPDETTVPDDQRHRLDTPRQDLTALARTTAPDAAEDVLRMAYAEGQEDAVRALYAVCRAHRLTRDHADHIVLDVRQRLTKL
jgi:hypothetical protein